MIIVYSYAIFPNFCLHPQALKTLLMMQLLNLYIKIGRFVCLTGSVSECRTAGMPNDCIDNHVTLPSEVSRMPNMQHCGHMLSFSVVGIPPGRH